jgi:succinate-semialdehyde dehydrogenase/glutarate-semialdehyde dehydrogenase
MEDSNGYFYMPSVLSNVTEEMLITFDETFGPVAPLIAFESVDDVIQKANNTKYGLAAYLYTNDLSRAFRVAEALEFGIVGLNDPVPAVSQAPFGGIKESGYGKEGGHQGIQEYLYEKFISINI